MTSQAGKKGKPNTGNGSGIGPAELLQIYQQSLRNLNKAGIRVRVANDPSDDQQAILAIAGVRYCYTCKALRLLEQMTETGCQYCEASR